MNINTSGMLRKPSGRLSQHESTCKIAGKTESSGQIVPHIFRTNMKRSFIESVHNWPYHSYSGET